MYFSLSSGPSVTISNLQHNIPSLHTNQSTGSLEVLHVSVNTSEPNKSSNLQTSQDTPDYLPC